MSGRTARRRAASLALAVAAGALGPLALSASPASAAPLTIEFACNVPAFNKVVPWTATLTPSFTGTGATQEVVVEVSDLAPMAPAPINGTLDAELTMTIDGTDVVATGSGPTTAAASSPIPVVDLTGPYVGDPTAPEFVIEKLDFMIKASGLEIAVNCVNDEDPEFPSPSPSPSTSTPPADDDKKGDGKKKGTPAKGKANFSCVLQELGSPFEYKPAVTLAGARAKADDSKVTVRLSLGDIVSASSGRGLAPLAIENGTMKVTASAKVGGETVKFSGTSKVNAAAFAPVPVPVLTSSIETDEDVLDVEITGFDFDFGTMAGMKIFSECDGGGKLSKMTVGVGALADDNEKGADTNTGTSPGDSLPKTGSGAPLVMFGLWSSALVLLAAALLLWLPKRRARES